MLQGRRLQTSLIYFVVQILFLVSVTPCLRIRQILKEFKCVSSKDMSQIKSLLLVKPNKRLAHSSAICCLNPSLPPVTDGTTACAPTFRSASPGKATLANKQLLQKAVMYFTQDLCRISGVLCWSWLCESGCLKPLDYRASCVSYLHVYGYFP